jgi:dihydrofolate synthase/folylpolyglutamate synthase
MTTHAEIVASLQSRWPENQVARGLGRIQALVELLGEPQHSYPVIQIAGTNGKGSTAIIIESLLLALGLRVGRYSSPHLERLNERIAIDGEPISDERFDELVADVLPLVEMIDERRIDDTAMTFYEVMTGLAFEAFAQAPVDVAVVEVGMGGSWDATNVADAQVAVICPIDFDHTALLGSTLSEIASEKAGIIKNQTAAVIAAQAPDAAKELIGHCAEVGARVYLEGIDFALLDRQPGVGGQVIRIEAAGGPVGDLLLPLFGQHMAQNATLAVAAVEAFLGGRPLAPDVTFEGLERVKAPARMEILRRSPTIILDTCHNPHGARATMAAMTEAFAFAPLIGVVAMMADKDVAGVLEVFAEDLTHIVCTSMKSTDRALPTEKLAELACDAFGPDRVSVAVDLETAVDEAVRLADEAGPGAGILIAGSVYAAGEARTLLRHARKEGA